MWKTVELSSVATVTAGQSPKGKHYNKEGRGTPFYQGKKDYGERYLKEPTVWTEVVTKLAEKDDILMSVRAPVGSLNIATQQICIGRGLAAIRPSTEILHDFLFYSLLLISQQLKGNVGIGFNSINKAQIEAIKIPLPPLAEQQRIVAKLDAAFAEIDRSVEICEEQISEALKLESHSLTSLFFSNKHIVRQLNELAQIKGGKRLPKGKKLTTEETGFPYIRVTDFNDNGSIDEESVQFVEPDVQAQISRYTISSDDVYVSIAGTIGKTGIVPSNLDNANLTENAAKLVLKECVDRDFIYFFTRTSSFEKQAIAQTREAAQPKLALERLGAVELPIYELPQQRQIAFDAKLLTGEIAKVIANRKDKLLQLAALKSSILSEELKLHQSEAA